METQPDTSQETINWLKDITLEQAERITRLETRIDKKHEELSEIKIESSKQREHENQFTQRMSEISTILEQATKNIDSTQKEINRLREDVDDLKEEVVQVTTKENTKEQQSKWIVGLLGTALGLIISLATLWLK